MRAQIIAIAGACASVAVVVTVRGLRSDPWKSGVDAASMTEDAPVHGAGPQVGWKVRPSDADHSTTSAPSSRQVGPGPVGRPGSPDGRAGTAGASRPGAEGGAVVTGDVPGAGGAGKTLAGGGQGIRVDSAAPPVVAVPFERARQPAGGQGEDPIDLPIVQQSPGDEAEDRSNLPPPEEGGPVLSIPFDQSAEPERGEGAVVEQGIAFESGEGAMFSTDSQFVIPKGGNIKGDAGTVSFWVRPEWEGADESDASLAQLRNAGVWENRLQVFKNLRYLRFLLTDSAGIESDVGAVIDAWRPGEWHQVTATWGDGVQTLYVDGRLAGQANPKGQLDFPQGTPLYIGSDVPNGVPGANSVINQFRVYNRPLAADEVAAIAQDRGR